MFYIILAILIIYLSQININKKYFSLINTLIYSSYVVIAFLLLSGYFVEEVRFFFRGIFDYFEWHLDYADDRMSERNFKNSDLVYYIAYAYSTPMFLIKLVSINEEFEAAKAFSRKKQLGGLVLFISALFLMYIMFTKFSSIDPYDMERVNNMTTLHWGYVTDKFGIIFSSIGMIFTAGICGVFMKLFVINLRQTLRQVFQKIKGVKK